MLFHAALGTLDYFQHLGRALAGQRLGPVVGVAVADAATIADLAALEAAVTGPLAYGAVADTAANLVPGGAAHAFVTDGIDVAVTGAATIAELAALGVARVSWGPILYREAMARLQDRLASVRV